jgi:hypothetical protein
MGTRWSAQEAGAYESLLRLLGWEWDPIGAGADLPDDEYRSYLPEFWRLVKADAPDAEIVAYLARTEEHVLGYASPDEGRRLDVARKAKALFAAWSLPLRP